VPEGVELEVGDVRESLVGLFRSFRPDVCFHLAAQADVRASVARPADDAAVNVLGSVRALEAAHESGAKVVFSSTGGAIYGDFVAIPSVEEYPKDPESPYGIAKLSVEYYMAYYARQHGLEAVALRFANVYGPRQDPHGEAGVVAIFCNRILDGRAMTTFGTGEQTRDYVFVKDVARAMYLAGTSALPPVGPLDARAFNIGTGTETSVNALAAELKRAAGSDTPVERAPARAGELQRSALVVDKARTVLGWTPQVELHEGLGETFRFFAARRQGQPA